MLTKQNKPPTWQILIPILVAVIALLVFGGRLLAGWTAWREARNESEAAYFRRIRRSARSGDQNAVLSDTMGWLDRVNDDSQAARLDLFLQKYGDPRALKAFLDQGESGTTEFLSNLVVARKRWLQAQRGGSAGYVLPELNG